MIDVPLLDAGQAVGVGAGQNDVRLALQTDATLVQRIGIYVACQLLKIFKKYINRWKGRLRFEGGRKPTHLTSANIHNNAVRVVP
jgi:hypothetical protein